VSRNIILALSTTGFIHFLDLEVGGDAAEVPSSAPLLALLNDAGVASITVL
jgi:hypothetical protein